MGEKRVRGAYFVRRSTLCEFGGDGGGLSGMWMCDGVRGVAWRGFSEGNGLERTTREVFFPSGWWMFCWCKILVDPFPSPMQIA
jgi:hypothetical protein